MNAPKSIVQNVFEKIGEQVKDTAKAVVSEPAKVLEQALGDDDNTDGETGIETLTVSSGQKQQSPKAAGATQTLLDAKRLEEEKKKQELLRLHRQRLAEEKAAWERVKAEGEQEEKLEEQKEEQAEIAQIQRQRVDADKAAVLGAAKKKQGTMESGRLKD